ncbi:MAG: pitrilysin family protein [Planctomycetia bacterium]|nr:pitrilysin family protein [Planctomycetia bacterium]
MMIHLHTFPNGLTLLGEEMEHFNSVAFSFRVPAGSVYDPVGKYGLSSFLCEMMLRGAGEYKNREFLERIDRLGIDRSESVSSYFITFSGAMLKENFPEALCLYTDILRRPHLPKEMLESSRMVLMRDVASEKDVPSVQLIQEMKERFYGETLGHDSDGREKDLEAITWDDIKNYYDRLVRPDGMILSVVGNFSWENLKEKIGDLFGNWSRKDVKVPEISENSRMEYFHMNYPSEQVHLGLMWETVPFSHPDRLRAWMGVSVLSEGMSSRLFTEVREARGLCYTMDTSFHSLNNRGSVFCYAATNTGSGQQTLDVISEEIKKLKNGISQEELNVLKAQYKSSLVMQQESCSAWCAGMASDFYRLGRVRTKEEIQKSVDDLTLDEINEYLAEHPPEKILCGTLGPEEVCFHQ